MRVRVREEGRARSRRQPGGRAARDKGLAGTAAGGRECKGVAGRGCARRKANFNIRPRALDFSGDSPFPARARRRPARGRGDAFQPAPCPGWSTGCASRTPCSPASLPLLPAALAASVRAGPLDETGWSLLGANAAVAASCASWCRASRSGCASAAIPWSRSGSRCCRLEPAARGDARPGRKSACRRQDGAAR